MFSPINEEKKLDWMYKGPTSLVDREEYLLGRTVDKTLEQVQLAEKQVQKGSVQPPKNHVEHECIPPSIRDYKLQAGEQVDLAAKLQEDPLVAIRKREEEARKKFLQNPVQFKKLQDALKAKQKAKSKKSKKKKKKKSRSDDSDDDLDRKLKAKLAKLRNSDQGDNLDAIVALKFGLMKDKLSEQDFKEIMEGEMNSDDDDDSSIDSNNEAKQRRAKYQGSSESEEDSFRKNRRKQQQRRQSPTSNKRNKDWRTNRKASRSKSRSPLRVQRTERRYNSDSDDYVEEKRNYGLVNADGSKIAASTSKRMERTAPKVQKVLEKTSTYKPTAKKRLTEDEKDKLRQEMSANAAWRSKDREKNLRQYREEDEKEIKDRKDFDHDFLQKQLIKSTSSSTVESRIKANINNIQRSGNYMNSNFSRKH